ncbi:MAG: hypothetical protein ABJE66_29910 [Deltaproteobacteria bacterium]
MRPWFVIPLMGLAGAGAAFMTTHDPIVAMAVGLCGAALTATIRAFLGPALVGAIAAAGGATLGVIDLLAVAPHVRAALAGAAGLFALSELARAKAPNASPLPAAGAALLAGVLDPSYVGLVAVSGIAWLTAPVPRPRGVLALPVLGSLATVFALVLACGGHSTVWHAWLGHATAHRDPVATLLRAGDLIGPLAACAGLAGVALCLAHGRLAAAAVASIVAVTAAMSLAGGFVAPAVPLLAALGAGIAIGRLAALVRLPVGQAFVGATTGFVLAVVPVSALFT